MSVTPTSRIQGGDAAEPLLQADIKLNPQEFIAELAKKIAAVDPYALSLILRYQELEEHYGSEEKFKEADFRKFIFFKKMMHMSGGELNSDGQPYTRAKLSMIENLTRDLIENGMHKYAKDFYITYPLESLREIREQCEKLFEEYPEFTMKDGVIDKDCQGVIDTIDSCVAFVESQHRLLGMDARGKQ